VFEGTEMGQGLNTKMIQIAAQAFGIDVSLVHIQETASDKVPNSPPTAASVGADIHGMAVLNACDKIKARMKPFIEAHPNPNPNPNPNWKARMKPFREAHPDWSFQQLCEAAWFERIDMCAEGYYATPKGSVEFKFPVLP